MEQTSMTVCACMGPQGNDPVCPCRMRSMSQQPSDQSTEEDRFRLTEVLTDIFQIEDHMSDKGYETAPLEDIPKRNNLLDERNPDKDM